MVEDKVIVEIKSVELLAPVHKKQLLTYLRLADKRLGLLINFHVALIKDGITRIVNGLEEDDHAKSPSRKEGVSDPFSPRISLLPGISRAQPLAITRASIFHPKSGSSGAASSFGAASACNCRS